MPSQYDATIYRWQDVQQDRPLEFLGRRRIIGERMMLSKITFDAGAHIPTHAHVNEQFTCMISGKMRVGIGSDGSDDRREQTLEPGDVLHVPSNVPHSADAIEDSIVLDIFSPTSEKTGVDRE